MGEKYKVEQKGERWWWFVVTGDPAMVVYATRSETDANQVRDALNSAHAAALATAEAELAALRAKWEALRGEVEAWRADGCDILGTPVDEAAFERWTAAVLSARTLTDSRHALENP